MLSENTIPFLREEAKDGYSIFLIGKETDERITEYINMLKLNLPFISEITSLPPLARNLEERTLCIINLKDFEKEGGKHGKYIELPPTLTDMLCMVRQKQLFVIVTYHRMNYAIKHLCNRIWDFNQIPIEN